jgi:hypothetical protein
MKKVVRRALPSVSQKRTFLRQTILSYIITASDSTNVFRVGYGRLGPLVDWWPDEDGYRLLSVRRDGVLALWNFATRRSAAWQSNGLC